MGSPSTIFQTLVTNYPAPLPENAWHGLEAGGRVCRRHCACLGHFGVKVPARHGFTKSCSTPKKQYNDLQTESFLVSLLLGASFTVFWMKCQSYWWGIPAFKGFLKQSISHLSVSTLLSSTLSLLYFKLLLLDLITTNNNNHFLLSIIYSFNELYDLATWSITVATLYPSLLIDSQVWSKMFRQLLLPKQSLGFKASWVALAMDFAVLTMSGL